MIDTARMAKPPRVLVVEDEALIGMMFEDALQELGCEIVGMCSSLENAVASAASLEIDVAILDINIHGKEVTPVGIILRDRGIPFVFSTGYRTDGIPEEFRERPLLGKPFRDEDIKRCLEEALGRRWTSGPPALRAGMARH